MTKKDMIYEILSETKLHGLDEKTVNNEIKKHRLEDVERLYKAFTNDRQHALFYASLFFRC